MHGADENKTVHQYKSFADRITYDDHPMNTNCTGTPIPVTIPVGVCTPVATGERITYKLVKAENYTCRSEQDGQAGKGKQMPDQRKESARSGAASMGTHCALSCADGCCEPVLI